MGGISTYPFSSLIMRHIVNPFLIAGYQGPDYFCDREKETDNIISALKNGRNITLISPRRIGKTGLIKHVFWNIQQQSPNAKCFYIDIFGTQSLYELVLLLGKSVIGKLDTFSESMMRNLTELLRSFQPSFTFDPITGAPSFNFNLQHENVEVGLQEIFAYLQHSDKECYIAIDEFQQITEYPEKGVEGLLRSYIQFIPNVHFIFAGSKKHLMDEIFSSPKRPFFQMTQKMTLGTIDKEKYYLFAQSFFNKQNKNFDVNTFDYIYNLMHGFTWYIQYILNYLYSKPISEYSCADVEDVLREIVEQEDVTFKSYCESLSKAQFKLLKAIAKENIVLNIYEKDFLRKYDLGASSTIQRALSSLVGLSFVLKEGDSAYFLYDPIFSYWLKMRG